MDLIDVSSKMSNLEEIVNKAKDWALLNGLTMRSKSGNSDQLEFVPFTLLPSNFPCVEYEEVRSLQLSINKLTHRVAQDTQFLRDSLNDTGRVDGFTKRLLDILDVAAGDSRCVRLGLLRSDYMLNDDDDTRQRRGERGHLDLGQVEDASTWTDATSRCKQVEMNTIASGQGWIGKICSRLHRYVLDEMNLTEYLSHMTENNPLEGLCSGMYEAWKLYNNSNAAILFVVEDVTQHIGDQRFHEYKLRELDPRIRIIRRNLSQLAVTAELDGEDRRLVVGKDHEIALVYFRSGYAPDQYHSEAEWEARLLLESSKAIKCPSIGYHLAGTKKIQQLLAQPGYLERFLEPRECEKLRRHFTGVSKELTACSCLYSLDFDEAGEAAVEMALAKPGDFVLKPQREGGANNLFGEDLKNKLEEMRHENERTAWILMEKIIPVTHKNYMVQPGSESNDRLKDVTSELGIFGVLLANDDEILVNKTVGHTLRTKLAECDEGGVSSGFGACDSPFLV